MSTTNHIIIDVLLCFIYIKTDQFMKIQLFTGSKSNFIITTEIYNLCFIVLFGSNNQLNTHLLSKL